MPSAGDTIADVADIPVQPTDLAEADALLKDVEAQIAALDVERSRLLAYQESLRQARERLEEKQLHSQPKGHITADSPPQQKITLLRRLFRGREDVYARRWESAKTGKSGYQPACQNEWIGGICDKRKVKCADCPHRVFLPLTDTVVANHIRGYEPSDRTFRDFTVGIYPLLPDETCWFLAVDFDKATWQDDALAFMETCRAYHIPAGLERSRSGNGGHIWIFFAEPIHASLARKLGAFLLTDTMTRRPEIGLDSYDRFFPNQDTMPQGGFGNLIALPLQRKPRERGNSLFVDDHLVPYPDQLAFLSSLKPMSFDAVATLVDDAQRKGQILGVRMAVEDDESPWAAPPSRRLRDIKITGIIPKQLTLVLGNQVYIPKEQLPPSLINQIIRIAAFQNPEFYKAQAMRLLTFGKPRIISCAEDFSRHIGLPRGCHEELLALLTSLGIKVEVVDERNAGSTIDLIFQGSLRPEQQTAVEHLLPHDTGVLAATTAFGKTVVASYLIATRKANTLVLVHRQQLLDQWVERLMQFLGLQRKEIGQIGGGKSRRTGIVDVALIQSLCRKGVVEDLVAEYGHLVVDECHHLSAQSFELVARACKAQYVTGLSATPTRKDGHDPIIFMQCGPIRYRVDARKQAAQRPFDHRVIVRNTTLRLDAPEGDKPPTIQDLYAAMVTDEARNAMILQDVITAVKSGRSPVVLTERKEHLELLARELQEHFEHVIVLKGGMGAKQRKAIATQLDEIPDTTPRVLVATGRYLGEGFDDPRLDTLFLTMPISWKGTLAQYAGRLHRLHDQKSEVIIYDYADIDIPMLSRMFEKRLSGYRVIGYNVGENETAQR